jgi:hypothetical protein
MRKLYAIAVLFCFLGTNIAASQQQSLSEPRPPGVGYYIAIRAMLMTDDDIHVFGASNLPAGSIITIIVYDHAGKGGKTFSEDAIVRVEKEGQFEVDVHHVKNLLFRNNLDCDAVFGTNFPKQPKEVLKVVGISGEYLGKPMRNPQVQSNGRETLLVATTVVKE